MGVMALHWEEAMVPHTEEVMAPHMEGAIAVMGEWEDMDQCMVE
jgi:hypothetical protein